MLRYNVILEDQAWVDLDEISDYYFMVLERPDLGVKLLRKLRECFDKLKIFPELHSIYAQNKHIVVRHSHLRQYNIYFWVDNERCKVHVIGILPPHRTPKI